MKIQKLVALLIRFIKMIMVKINVVMEKPMKKMVKQNVVDVGIRSIEKKMILGDVVRVILIS